MEKLFSGHSSSSLQWSHNRSSQCAMIPYHFDATGRSIFASTEEVLAHADIFPSRGLIVEKLAVVSLQFLRSAISLVSGSHLPQANYTFARAPSFHSPTQRGLERNLNSLNLMSHGADAFYQQRDFKARAWGLRKSRKGSRWILARFVERRKRVNTLKSRQFSRAVDTGISCTLLG